MATEYIIYTDESTKEGQYFSNFYGGALVTSKNLSLVQQCLEKAKQQENLLSEIKWSKVTSQYLTKYQAVIDVFFDLVAANLLKVRIMFTQNRYVPQLTNYQKEDSYYILYYQFIKHAFGLQYSNNTGKPIRLRLYLDKLPGTRERNARFKEYIAGLQKNSDFQQAKIVIQPDQIAEVDSRDHVILQYLDVVLGAMQFRLNDMHLIKPRGQRCRAKRTIAKEKLYKHIYRKITFIYPHFNIGVSTGDQDDPHNRWLQPYRHWLFVPRDAQVDPSKTKKRKRRIVK